MINDPCCTPFDPFFNSYVYIACFGCLSTLVFSSEDLPITNERILVTTQPNSYSKIKRLFGKTFKNQQIWNFSTGCLNTVNFEDLKFTLSLNAHIIDKGKDFNCWILPLVTLSTKVKRLIGVLGENLLFLEHDSLLNTEEIQTHVMENIPDISVHNNYDYSLSVLQKEVVLPPNIKYNHTFETPCEKRGHILKYSKIDLFRFCPTCLMYFDSDKTKQRELVYKTVLKFFMNNDFECLNSDMSYTSYIKGHDNN